MTDSAGPYCAHLKVSWRTEQNEDGSTTGWWECDYGCGCKFTPTTVVHTHFGHERELEALRRELEKIIAHTARLPGPSSNELLNGLIDSCDRIARRALARLDAVRKGR